MDPSSDNQKALSYHDILLRKADVRLLQGPDWINDQVICRVKGTFDI